MDIAGVFKTITLWLLVKKEMMSSELTIQMIP